MSQYEYKDHNSSTAIHNCFLLTSSMMSFLQFRRWSIQTNIYKHYGNLVNARYEYSYNLPRAVRLWVPRVNPAACIISTEAGQLSTQQWHFVCTLSFYFTLVTCVTLLLSCQRSDTIIYGQVNHSYLLTHLPICVCHLELRHHCKLLCTFMGAMDKRVIRKDADNAYNVDTTNKVADCCVRVMSRTD